VNFLQHNDILEIFRLDNITPISPNIIENTFYGKEANLKIYIDLPESCPSIGFVI